MMAIRVLFIVASLLALSSALPWSYFQKRAENTCDTPSFHGKLQMNIRAGDKFIDGRATIDYDHLGKRLKLSATLHFDGGSESSFIAFYNYQEGVVVIANPGIGGSGVCHKKDMADIPALIPVPVLYGGSLLKSGSLGLSSDDLHTALYTGLVGFKTRYFTTVAMETCTPLTSVVYHTSEKDGLEVTTTNYYGIVLEEREPEIFKLPEYCTDTRKRRQMPNMVPFHGKRQMPNMVPFHGKRQMPNMVPFHGKRQMPNQVPYLG
ncbi:uncharacterized protein LOC116604070 isoform X2 [Nematostella vectensis]|uniref:uncharacterized protein LOC116604070 isoform X2 n=1 Tax=Nematostella vectensis TaxID=45351 RepID=UPI0020770409|nr:uncharacterized protein LOC116604070 isoform X2 [Nematostella vectensis]